MQKRPVWDYLFYLSILVLIIWLILKVAGLINSPVWLEYGIPMGSFILALVMFFQSIAEKMGDLRLGDARLEGKFSRLDSKLSHIDKDFERVKADLTEV